MLKPEMLREAGYNPERVNGYAFGFGLERLALIKLGLKSVHELWRSPYVQ
jgi:phenylalanyl-tRNA synthetase alpha chain